MATVRDAPGLLCQGCAPSIPGVPSLPPSAIFLKSLRNKMVRRFRVRKLPEQSTLNHLFFQRLFKSHRNSLISGRFHSSYLKTKKLWRSAHCWAGFDCQRAPAQSWRGAPSASWPCAPDESESGYTSPVSSLTDCARRMGHGVRKYSRNEMKEMEKTCAVRGIDKTLASGDPRRKRCVQIPPCVQTDRK